MEVTLTLMPKKKEIEKLESSTQAVDFWSDRARANDVLKKITNLKRW